MTTQEQLNQSVMGTYGRFPVTLEQGAGEACQGEDGTKYIDFGSGIGTYSLGYCNPAWVEAVCKQARTLQHTSNLYYTKVQAEFAQKLCQVTGYSKVFFCNSGAEANECAIKLARKYSFDRYGKGRSTILTLRNSFHGRTLCTLSATGQDVFHNYFFPFVEGFRIVETNDIADLQQKLDDTVIFDTAGRLGGDEVLMQQARDIRDAVIPYEILFVIDAMIGQDAVKTAKAFDEGVDFTGVVLSKLDGDARGGAALSVASVTGKPILFASNGEGLKDFEVFHPDRLASRILDMGDIMTLSEQAQKQFDEEEARKAAAKISDGSFGLDDFLDQLQQVRKLGSMKSLLGMIPGMAEHRKELEQFDEREIDRTEAIIRSMTPAERRDPSIINGSRRARIAYGSGVTVSQVNALLQRFEQAAKMMKRMSNRGGMGGGIPGFGGPAMGGGKKKGKNKKKGGKSGNPMTREAEEKALRDQLAGKSSGSTDGSAFAKKPQNPALPAGLEQMMGNVDSGTELPPNLGGGLGGVLRGAGGDVDLGLLGALGGEN